MQAAVDLGLLVIKAMDRISRVVADRNVGVDAERLVRQIIRKAEIDAELIDVPLVAEVLHGAWQEVIGAAILVDLDLGCAGRGDAVGVRKESEQIVEAVVLQIDDDDVLDVAQLGGRALAGQGADRGAKQ